MPLGWRAEAQNASPEAFNETFSTVQRTTLERISAYFQSLTSVSGTFVQISPSGNQSSGTFHLNKPGRIRFDYDPPSQVRVISDGSNVLIEDDALGSRDLYGLAFTPLKFLVDADLNLIEDTHVEEVFIEPEEIAVVIRDAPGGAAGRLTLLFSGLDYRLLQWSVVDSGGGETTVVLQSLEPTETFPKDAFLIAYDRLQQR